MRYVTDGDGSPVFTRNARHFVPTLDFTGKFVKVRLNVDDVAKLAAMDFRLSSNMCDSDTYTFNIPLFKAERLVDETGAGDVFMAGFIKEFLASQDVEKSALFGSAAASFAVEDFGVKGIGSLEEINERISSLR